MVLSLDSLSIPADKRNATLGQIDDGLLKALDPAGYVERRYFAFPGGFAMVSRLERIEANGKPATERWALDNPRMVEFSLSKYLRALFFAPSGRFRFVAFVVTDRPLTESVSPTTREEYQRLFGTGILNGLPAELRRVRISDETRCTVLIYEFLKPPGNAEATMVSPSSLSALQHLTAASLTPPLH